MFVIVLMSWGTLGYAQTKHYKQLKNTSGASVIEELVPRSNPRDENQTSPTSGYDLWGIILKIFGGLLITVVGALISSKLIELWKNRITIRRIVVDREDDDDISAVLNLYEHYFLDEEKYPEGTNYPPEEMIEIMNKELDGANGEIENITLVAKYKGAVVGFIFCHYYKDFRKANISYAAIDTDSPSPNVRQVCFEKLVRKLKSVLLSKELDCECLLFDCNSSRLVRSFKSKAKRLRQRAYKFEFDYRCPPISLESNVESKLIFMCVPFKKEISSSIKREQLMEYLEFYFFNCIGNLYKVSDPRYEQHRKVLRKYLKKYERTLPRLITVS